MSAVWWVLPALGVLVLAAWAGHRALLRADGSGAGVADAFGNFVDLFEPARARAARDLRDHEHQGPVLPSPAPDHDERAVVLVRGPDVSPGSTSEVKELAVSSPPAAMSTPARWPMTSSR